MKKSVQVKLDDKTITVSKLPLLKYSELLKVLKKLPEKLKGFDSSSMQNLGELIPELLEKAFPEIIDFISISVDLTTDEVSNLGLTEVVKIVDAIIQTNNFDELFGIAKKALAHYQTKNQKLPSPVEKTTGSGGQ